MKYTSSVRDGIIQCTNLILIKSDQIEICAFFTILNRKNVQGFNFNEQLLCCKTDLTGEASFKVSATCILIVECNDVETWHKYICNIIIHYMDIINKYIL